jgi:hypothetical protein
MRCCWICRSPDSQGLDTLVRLHEAAKYVPIVLLTGIEDEALRVRLIQAGAQDYLVKALLSTIICSLARIIHDGSSSPTHPSPILWGRDGWGTETGARSREAGQPPAWEFRRGCAPFVEILQGGWPPCKSGRGRFQSRAREEGRHP